MQTLGTKHCLAVANPRAAIRCEEAVDVRKLVSLSSCSYQFAHHEESHGGELAGFWRGLGREDELKRFVESGEGEEGSVAEGGYPLGKHLQPESASTQDSARQDGVCDEDEQQPRAQRDKSKATYDDNVVAELIISEGNIDMKLDFSEDSQPTVGLCRERLGHASAGVRR